MIEVQEIRGGFSFLFMVDEEVLNQIIPMSSPTYFKWLGENKAHTRVTQLHCEIAVLKVDKPVLLGQEEAFRNISILLGGCSCFYQAVPVIR